MVRCVNCDHYENTGKNKGWCHMLHTKIKASSAYAQLPCDKYKPKWLKAEPLLTVDKVEEK